MMISTSVKILWALLLVELYIHNGDAGIVTIGAFFSEESSNNVFGHIIQDGINRVRNNRTLLPEPHSMTYVNGDSKPVNAVYTAIEEICDMINSDRPSALVVLDNKCPDCSDLAGVLSHGANPIFSVDVGSFEGGSKAFKMYPSAEDMSEFFIDILHYFKWRAFSLLIDSGDAFANFEGVMQEAKSNDWNVTVITMDPDDLEGTLTKTATAKSKNILLYCVDELLCRRILDKGIEMNNMPEPAGPLNAQYTWILGNLDLSLPEQYKDSLEDTNTYITYFTMNFTRELQYTKPSSNPEYDSIYSFPIRQKLAFDAVLAIGHALGKFVERREQQGQRGESVLPGDTQMLTCPTAVAVGAPNDLTTELMGISFEGMTGNVAFDENGNRVNYTITIFSGRGDTLRQLRGEWAQNPNYLEDRRKEEWQNEGRLNTTSFRVAKDRKIRIVSIEVPPFLFLSEKLSRTHKDRYVNYRYRRADEPISAPNSDSNRYTGDGRFEGYIIELLEEIKSKIKSVDFDYVVELVPDGKYGAGSGWSKIWNGMVGEVVRGKADVAAGPLTVTGSRKSVVDFTIPFMSSGIQPLILHPNYVHHDPFRIIYPFSIEVWFLNLFIFGLVALMIYAFNLFDPYEWKLAVESKKVGEDNADNFSLKNSIWFCTSTLFLQSYHASPRSNAGRCIAGFWWLYLLTMVFLYIFNLQFFVTSQRRLAFMNNNYDLKAQKTVKYGTVKGGNTYHYFKKTNAVKSFWHKMNNDHADVYVKDVAAGVERVRNSNGRYAFLGESPLLRYIASQKPCDVEVVGEYIARTQYAFAVAKDSPLREHISDALEAIGEKREDLERDWWDLDNRRHRCHNLTEFERAGAYSLVVNEISGIYYILAIGIVASTIVFVGEIVFYKCCGGDTKSNRGDKSKTKKNAFKATQSGGARGGFGKSDTNDRGAGGGGGGNMWI